MQTKLVSKPMDHTAYNAKDMQYANSNWQGISSNWHTITDTATGYSIQWHDDGVTTPNFTQNEKVRTLLQMLIDELRPNNI